MASAKHASVRLSTSELLSEANTFMRGAWRDSWLSMLLVIAAHALWFMGSHVAVADWRPGLLGSLSPLLFLAYLPLYGGLYRAALGHWRGIGPGGLQWRGVEWRLISVGAVIAFVAFLFAAPFFVVTGIAALIPATHAPINAMGGWSRWAFVAAPIWLVFLWLAGPRLARLSLGWPYSVVHERTQPLAGWGPSQRSGWAILRALILSFMPVALGWLALYAMTLVEPEVFVGNYWPLPEAVGGGVLLGVLHAVVQTPLSAGVLSGAFFLLNPGEDPAEHIPSAAEQAAVAASAAAASAGIEGATADAATDEEKADVDAADAHTADGDPAEGEAHEGDTDHAGKDPEDPAADHHPDAGHAEPTDVPDESTEHAAAVLEGQAHPAHDDPTPELTHPDDSLLDQHAAGPDAPTEHHVEVAPPAGDGIEPLSPWPHSVLPPWPSGVNVDLARARLGLPPLKAVTISQPTLAPEGEPAHPSRNALEPR